MGGNMEKQIYKLSLSEKIASLFFLIIVMSQGMITPYFYLNWFLGGLTIFYFFLKVLVSNKISKVPVIVYVLSTSWILVLIVNLVWGNILDLSEHFTYITLYLFYMFIAVLIVKLLLVMDSNKIDAIMFFVNKIWILLNLIFYIIFLFFNEIYGSVTFSGVMENRNNFAVATTILISYSIFFKERYKHYSRNKNDILIILSFLLVLTSVSVKGFVGWLLIYIFSNFSNREISISKRKRNQGIVILMALFILIFLVVVDNPIIYRIERFIMVFTSPNELRQGESAYLRSFFINESFNVIKENFFNGIGLRNSKYYLIPPNYIARGEMIGTYSHNNFLEIFISGGVFAFLLYYIPYFYSMIKMWTRRKKNNFLNYVLILSFYKLFIDFGSVNYDILAVNIIFALIIYGQFLNSTDKLQ